MAISSNQAGLLVTGAALVIILGYFAYLKVDVTTYPNVEIAGGIGLDGPPVPGMSPSEYVKSSDQLNPTMFTRHRYPLQSGSNITTLIHRGFSPLRNRTPADDKWFECPPAEVAF